MASNKKFISLSECYNNVLNGRNIVQVKKAEPVKQPTTLETAYYKVILEKLTNEDVALYGKEVPSNTQTPPNAPGLQVIGVADDKLANQIKHQVKLERGNINEVLKSLFEKARVKSSAAFSVIKGLILNSNIDNIDRVLHASLPNGLFKIPTAPGSTFNMYELATKTVTDIDNNTLTDFFFEVVNQTPKTGSTNIGPGELYFTLFGDAKAAGGGKDETGSKSGDLDVNGEDIEVKATTNSGARLGGDGTANQAITEIPKLLGKDFSGKLQTELAGLNEIKNKITELQNATPEQAEQAFLRFKADVLNINNSKHLESRFYFTSKFRDMVKTANDRIKYRDWSLVRKGEGGAPFITYFTTYVNQSIEAVTKQLNNLEGNDRIDAVTRLDILLARTLQILKTTPSNLSPVDIIALFNNEGDIDVKQAISTLGDTAAILNRYADNVAETNKLIGALHLYSYTKKTKFGKLMLVNVTSKYKNTTNTIIFAAPNTLAEAEAIIRTAGVGIDTQIDYGASTKTVRAKSVNIYYKP